MTGRSTVRHVLLPAAIFAYACLLRLVFFSGFILCDDRQEFSSVYHILLHGPVFADQFHLRFGVWLFNVLAFRLLGVSEATFFVPTMLMSASLPLVGYAILLRWRYSVAHAAVAAVTIASAPFEVLIGTLRANDLILSWLIGIGVLILVAPDRWPVVQGLTAAVLFWLAFYVKLWVVYLLPALGIYYLFEGWKRGRWRGAVTFAVSSLVLHGATCLVWKRLTGSFLPFIWSHAATYPFSRADLPRLFWEYPRLLLEGSEIRTTLFGGIPYLVVLMFVLKATGTLLGRRYRVDVRDWALFGAYGSFLVLLNFFPNNFSFDRYFSAPRIFRYLAPLSFPMTLHVAKMLLDLAPVSASPLGTSAPVACLLGLTAVNLVQTSQATRPGLVYREKLMAAVRDIRERRPPKVLAEDWLAYFLTNVYLKNLRGQVQIVPIPNTYAAREYEAWLERNQGTLPAKTVLLTGLGSCVHYGAQLDGFRLAYFQRPLDPAWKLVKDYGPITYLSVVESAKLWELSAPTALASPAVNIDTNQEPKALFTAGMANFDRGDYLGARPYFRAILDTRSGSQLAADALYFDTICNFRSGDLSGTLSGFQELVRRFPDSIWVPAAHYHMGLVYAALGDSVRAQAAFEYVREKFPREDPMARLAADRLGEIGTDRETGLLPRLWRRLRSGVPPS